MKFTIQHHIPINTFIIFFVYLFSINSSSFLKFVILYHFSYSKKSTNRPSTATLAVPTKCPTPRKKSHLNHIHDLSDSHIISSTEIPKFQLLNSKHGYVPSTNLILRFRSDSLRIGNGFALNSNIAYRLVLIKMLSA